MNASKRVSEADSKMQLGYLGIAVTIMVALTIYPLMMMNPSGAVDHWLVMTLLWAMCVGFVRGVGFVPHTLIWRWAFSGWTWIGSLILAVVFKFSQ